MIRLWWLIWYMNRLKVDGTWLDISDRDRLDTLIFFLASKKKLLEDWRKTIKRLFIIIFYDRNSNESILINLPTLGQAQQLRDLISKAKKKGLIDEGRPGRFDVTWEGREFLWPLGFLKACGEEYKALELFIGGGIVTYILEILFKHYF